MADLADLKTDAPGGSSDGRRKRGEDNRARIVAAMLEIVQSGELAPSAEQVASRMSRTSVRHAALEQFSTEKQVEAIRLALEPIANGGAEQQLTKLAPPRRQRRLILNQGDGQ